MPQTYSIPFLGELTSFLSVTALDESVDILSCFITSFFFTFSALLIKITGLNLQCWVPQTYDQAWEDFAESYCFLKDTYWYPVNDPIEDISATYAAVDSRLKYYQWTCMYFTVAATVSMLPKFLWKLSQNVTDMPILYFCKTTTDIQQKTLEERKEKVEEMAELLECKLIAQYSRYSLSSIRPIFVYTFIKILYAIIAFLQFFMLGYFLGNDDIFWGYKLAKNIINKVTWEESGVFPRMTFCDFTIRMMAGMNSEETIQCMLGLNEFNEKIFLFLWFWLLLTFIVTVINNIFVFHFFYQNRLALSLLHRIRNKKDADQETELNKFVNKFLRYDGQLVLSFVKSQNDMVAQELACKMWEIYKKKDEDSNLPDVDAIDAEIDSDFNSDSNDSDNADIDNDSENNTANDANDDANSQMPKE